MRVLLLGLLLVSSGCALFGLADSMVTFAGARAIQGMGGAAILVAGMAIIMDCSLDVEGDVARQVQQALSILHNEGMKRHRCT
jgi:MFS family permease